jgi:hypothetical protein
VVGKARPGSAPEFRYCTKSTIYGGSGGGQEPHGLQDRQTEGWTFCRQSDCTRCPESRESATVHTSCFRVFRSHIDTSSEALGRLWLRATWRSPWQAFAPKSDPFLIRGDTCHLSSFALAQVAPNYGFPELLRLPSELVEVIRNNSSTTPLWRLAAAVDLACDLKKQPEEKEVQELDMSNVIGWARGGKLLQTRRSEHSLKFPVIRLTIDTHGLKAIDRLPEHPLPSGEDDHEPSKDEAFAFLDHQQFKLLSYVRSSSS